MQKEPDWCKTGLYKYTVCCESICVCYSIYFRWLKGRDYREFLISVVFGSDTTVPLGVETAELKLLESAPSGERVSVSLTVPSILG